MNKYLFLIVIYLLMQNGYLAAQIAKNQVRTKNEFHEYYINISGVKSREEVIKLQEDISKQTAVTFFRSEQYPVLYYLLKSTNEITLNEFSKWIGTKLYKIEFFGEGLSGKEKAILIGRKQLKAN